MARTIASLIVMIGSLTAPCTCFTWTGGPPPNGTLQECLGNNVSLDWDFLTSTEDTVLSVQWLFTNATHTDPKHVATGTPRYFLQSPGTKTRMEFLPKAGLRLYNVSTQDLGTYTVHINLFHKWNFIGQHRSVTIVLPDSPVISSGRLRAWVDSKTITVRRSSHVRLACGTINNHQHAKLSITWTTPSGRRLPSTSHADGVFYLTLDNPVAGGPYSCQLQGITALGCLRNGSQATMAVVDVDALGARMLVLEDIARRHDRDLELQERVADVGQSINNITVNLQVVDELTEKTSERMDNLCKHVHVIDNVTTETAQRMDKVTRNVEDQREAQSRMKESLNGVIEELTNQSGRVTNLALSVNDLKLDTEKLNGSVDSLISDTKTLSRSVNSLTWDTETLSESVDSLKSDTNKLSGSVESLQSDTKTLKRSIGSLTSELHLDTKTLKGSFDSLASDTETLSGSVDSLKADTKILSGSVDSLKSDTKTLKRSLDSLTSELHSTVDLQRNQITAQSAVMTSLMQKMNNLTELAERQQEKMLQQNEVIGDLLSKVIQRRQDGSIDFYRGWQDYVNGFGFDGGEYWIGLDNIYHMTRTARYTLRVDLTDFNGTTAYAEYKQFSIDGADQNYTLHVSGYSGNAGDSLAYHNNMSFSTHDRDNDVDTGNCAASWHSAWWFKQCYYSSLNGRYKTSAATDKDGIIWWHWTTALVSLKKTQMKLRPVV